MALHVGTPAVGLAVRGSARDAGDYSSALGVVSHSGAETRSGAADLEWRPADDHALTFQWSTLRGEDIGVPGSGGVFTGFYPRTDRTKLSLGYEGRDLAPWLARLDARVYAQDQTEVFATVLDLPPIPAGPFDLLIDTTTERTGDVRTAGLDVQAGSPIMRWPLSHVRDRSLPRRGRRADGWRRACTCSCRAPRDLPAAPRPRSTTPPRRPSRATRAWDSTCRTRSPPGAGR